jgi:aminopeptidase N
VETPDEIEALFDTITYEKAASVMRMLEAYLGRDTFRAGVNAYLERFAYGNATSADFWTTMTATSGKPVDRILSTFVNQRGVPLLEASSECRNDQTVVRVTQRRFFADPALANRRDRTLWQIPVCVKAANGAAPRCDLVTRRTQTLEATGPCTRPTIVNANARGYFRVAYTPALMDKLAPDAGPALTAPERLSLVADGWDLVKSGRRTVADYLTIAGGFDREHVSGVLAEVTSRFEFIRDFLTDAGTRPAFQAWVRRLLAPLYDEIGGTRREDDPEDRRALRAVLIESLGGTARDAATVASASAALDGALARGVGLDPIVADAVVQVAAQQGDAALFDALTGAAQRAASPDERYRYLLALGAFEDPALVDRGLRYALSSELKSQDTARYLARFLGNPAVNGQAWQFTKQHWAELEPKIAVSFGTVRVIEALGAFCTKAERDDIRSFFAARNLGPAVTTLEQAMEEISNCVAVKSAQTPVLASWLRNQK